MITALGDWPRCFATLMIISAQGRVKLRPATFVVFLRGGRRLLVVLLVVMGDASSRGAFFTLPAGIQV